MYHSSKRATRKKGSRKAAATVTTPKKRITALEICEDSLRARHPPPLDDEETKSDAEEHDDEEPDWLDHMYPWSESKRQPTAAEKLRLKRLEQFFDRFY